jgi:hypothetical protein
VLLTIAWCCLFAQVVQVYTYVLNSLTSSNAPATDSSGGRHKADGPGHVPGGDSSGQDIAGWSLKLVMEYCNEVICANNWHAGLTPASPSHFEMDSALSVWPDHASSAGLLSGYIVGAGAVLTFGSRPALFERSWFRKLVERVSADDGLPCAGVMCAGVVERCLGLRLAGQAGWLPRPLGSSCAGP